MMTYSETLIAAIHPALHPEPMAEPVLTIQTDEAVWISITDERFTLVREHVPALELLLREHTLTTLIAALPVGLGVELVSNDWAGVGAVALIPIADLAIPALGTAQIHAYTSILWRTIRPMAAGLSDLRATIMELVRQIDIRRAEGAWLDAWGMLWDIPRLAEEPDPAYRTRIIFSLTLPRANNHALEMLIFQAFGRVATVRDGDLGGIVTLNSVGDLWGPTGSSVWGPQQAGAFSVDIDAEEGSGGYTIDQLTGLIRRYKAAGTEFVLNTRFAPTVEVYFADITVEGGA